MKFSEAGQKILTNDLKYVCTLKEDGIIGEEIAEKVQTLLLIRYFGLDRE